ncbi:MAG TPA: MBL fold metallo-hydrolase [Kofleriaceae bacterium]|nr:MBL fold metallo-hydrolase [Kofleriaceae bacterium]
MSCLVLALAALWIPASPAHASAPFAKTQAPGWYRMMLGDFEITALNDGTAALPMEKLLTNSTPAKIDAALTKAYLKPPFETSINCFLVNTGSKLVLIDAGTGSLFGPTLGKAVAALKASGYQPEQVDEIFITHMHGDHIGNLVASGKLVFPNATVRAGKADADYWLSQDKLDKAPADQKDGFQAAQASLNPYVKAGKFKPIEGDVELVPGIKAIAAPGHTPGHTIYQIESKGQKLVVWGDLMHVAAVQFLDPSVTIHFDSDPKAAAAQRKKAYADAAKNGYLVAAAHISFPGIGQLRAEGAGYRWYPVDYVNNAPAGK